MEVEKILTLVCREDLKTVILSQVVFLTPTEKTHQSDTVLFKSRSVPQNQTVTCKKSRTHESMQHISFTICICAIFESQGGILKQTISSHALKPGYVLMENDAGLGPGSLLQDVCLLHNSVFTLYAGTAAIHVNPKHFTNKE